MTTALSLVQIEGWTLAAGGFEDGLARVRDIELAEHLGYERPSKIRDLIARLMGDGKLSSSAVLTTVGKTSATGGRPGREFWLTEAQALKVVAKSETAKADAILDELIRVFLLLRDAPVLADPQAALLAHFEQRFQSMVAPMLETMATMGKLLSELSGATIRPSDATWLQQEVTIIARLLVSAGMAKTENAARRRIYNRLSGAVNWFGAGRSWRALPAARFPEARALLVEMRREAEAAMPTADQRQRQLALVPRG